MTAVSEGNRWHRGADSWRKKPPVAASNPGLQIRRMRSPDLARCLRPSQPFPGGFSFSRDRRVQTCRGFRRGTFDRKLSGIPIRIPGRWGCPTLVPAFKQLKGPRQGRNQLPKSLTAPGANDAPKARRRVWRPRYSLPLVRVNTRDRPAADCPRGSLATHAESQRRAVLLRRWATFFQPATGLL